MIFVLWGGYSCRGPQQQVFVAGVASPYSCRCHPRQPLHILPVNSRHKRPHHNLHRIAHDGIVTTPRASQREAVRIVQGETLGMSFLNDPAL